MKYNFNLDPNEIPTYDKLIVPLMYALYELGGSGSIDEIDEKVFEITNLSEEVISAPHNNSVSRGEVSYRLAWARTYLKQTGLIENSSRGIWSTKCTLEEIESIESQEIVNKVREISKIKRLETKKKEEELQSVEEYEDSVEDELNWKENLLDILLPRFLIKPLLTW